MRSTRSTVPGLLVLLAAGIAWCFGGCSNSGAGPGDDAGAAVGEGGLDATLVGDAAPGDDSSAVDAGPSDAGQGDAAAQDASDAPPVVTGMKIVTITGAPLQAAAGDAVRLKVVLTLSDGTTQDLPTGTVVRWIAPATVVAGDPNDAGAGSVLPEAGALPTAFYLSNPFRPDRTTDPGVLFVIDPGTALDGGVTVTASVGDAGQLSALVTVGPAPAGDADAGMYVFQKMLACAGCHGLTAAGSPPLPDGGFDLQGVTYPYPAPGLNDAPDSGHLASDSAWNEALFGVAAQGDIDNHGVALRQPMPDWLGQLSTQNLANVYAFLKTQKQ